jgi:hypothetical protein
MLHGVIVGRERQLTHEAAERQRRALAAGVIAVELEVGKSLVVRLALQLLADVVDDARDEFGLTRTGCDISLPSQSPSK